MHFKANLALFLIGNNISITPSIWKGFYNFLPLFLIISKVFQPRALGEGQGVYLPGGIYQFSDH
jgi:hypothetical protein